MMGDSAAAALAVGTGTPIAISGLEIIGELGLGAHAVVYRVRRGGTDYALKTLRVDIAAPDDAAVAFRREAGLLACVDHPSVGRVYEVGDVGGAPYLVMELIEGRPLAQVLDGGPIPVQQAARLAGDLASALAAAHRVGVVHRDVTPHNVMILPTGQPKLVDFGLAAHSLTHHVQSQAAGTFAYSAPEQTGMLARAVDGRADLYGLGVVLFECLTGVRPFEADDVGELIRLHAVAVPPDVSALRPEVPAALAALVERLLAKDPDDRYQNGEDVAADLRRLSATPQGSADEVDLVQSARRPMLGRQAELVRLQSRWEQARGGNGGAVRITGSPGAGKTRLAEELADRVRAAGYPVLTLDCAEPTLPLAPFRAALERFARNLDRLPTTERADAAGRLRAAAGDAASVLQLLSPALAGALQAPPLAEEDRQEQLGAAVAAFLPRLAHAEGGLMLVVDGAQWLDDGSARVLRELGSGLRGCPLLVLTAERQVAEDHVPTWLSEGDRHLADTHIRLKPLDEEQISSLASTQLGGAAVGAQLTTQLAVRSHGNPFAVLEYLRAMLDACVIWPSWGSWVLDERALDRLALPDDVLDLVIARIDALPGASRALFAAAAAIDAPFRPELLARVCGVETSDVVTAVEEAMSRGILEVDGGEYTFLHQRMREAVLADLDESASRALHQRIGEVLEDSSDVVAGPGHSYVVARHFAAGNPHEAPDRVLRACFAAASEALSDQAPALALEFLDLAGAAAELGSIPLDSAFHRAAGLAQLRVGRLADARLSLTTACAGEPDPIRRAEMFGLIAEAYHHDFASSEALAAVRHGLAELGHPLPVNPVVLMLSTLRLFFAGLLIRITGRGFGTATGVERERFRVEAVLYSTASLAASVAMRKALTLAFNLRALHPTNRLGSGPEYVRQQAAYALLNGVARRRGAARRCFETAFEQAKASGDPRLVAQVAWTEAIGADNIPPVGPTTGAALRAMLQEHGRWLDLGEYLAGASSLGMVLVFRGYVHEAATWYERGRRRMESSVTVPGHPIAMLAVQIAAATGQHTLAEERLATMRTFVTTVEGDPGQLVTLAIAAAYAAHQFGDVDAADAAAAEIRQMRLVPRRVWPTQRSLWVYLARGALAVCHSAPPEQLNRRLAEARQAVRELRRAASTPTLRAFYHAAFGDYLQLLGQHDRALRELSRADRLGESLDLPQLACTTATVRARALRMLGHPGEAGRQAKWALFLASDLGMEQLARDLRREFRISETATATGSRRPRASGASAIGTGSAGRRLAALQQISLAAATVLDPDQLARVALDETIRIFGAERAILFLPDPASTRLLPHLGRDTHGHDLEELTGYGSTFVEEVRRTGEALVITSGEQGAALGSRSVVAHGLRSVMVAPLQLKGELLGLLYLDSRIAKGVFTEDDVDTLTAINCQIAASMVTAETAQLEATVKAAERRSELADTMRTSMGEVSRTLDPAAVTAQLLATLVRAIGADLGAVVHADGTVLRTTTGDASTAEAVPESDPAVVELSTMVDSACFGWVDGGPPGLTALLPTARTWIAVPLHSWEHRVGLLLLLSARAEAYDDGQVRVAAALAEQGMVAYNNAVLYSQVQQLASTDMLTGMYNRRHFFQLAGDRFDTAEQQLQPLAAMMLDIDHFKRVNDTYGHGVGDDVIREVALRLQDVLSETDIIGRYGGEEFALLLSTRTTETTVQLAERLRRAVEDTPIGTRTGPVSVTISIGTTQLHGDDTTIEETLARADGALYRAKESGRNRVMTA